MAGLEIAPFQVFSRGLTILCLIGYISFWLVPSFCPCSMYLPSGNSLEISFSFLINFIENNHIIKSKCLLLILSRKPRLSPFLLMSYPDLTVSQAVGIVNLTPSTCSEFLFWSSIQREQDRCFLYSSLLKTNLWNVNRRGLFYLRQTTWVNNVTFSPKNGLRPNYVDL